MDCEKVQKHPLRDPQTNRLLKPNDPKLRQMLDLECKLDLSKPDWIDQDVCDAYRQNPKVNPVTNLEFTDSKLTGRLNEVCGFASHDIPVPNFQQTQNVILNDRKGLKYSAELLKIDEQYQNDFIKFVKAQSKYINSLSKEEKDVIKIYETVQMYKFSDVINGKAKFCDLDQSSFFDLPEIYLTFDRILQRAPKCPDLWVFRGERVDIHKNYLRDKSITKPMFMSTTCSMKKAEFYASNEYSFFSYGPVDDLSVKAVSAIFIPAGTPCLFVSLGLFGQNNDQIGYDERLEIVLPPCTLTKIGEVDNNFKFSPYMSKTLSSHPKLYVLKVESTTTIQPFVGLTFPSPQQFLDLFQSTFKQWWEQNDSDPKGTWVVKGGLGLNLFLKTFYQFVNLTPSFDLDLGYIYDSDKYTPNDFMDMKGKLIKDIEKYFEKASQLFGVSSNRFKVVEPKMVDNKIFLFIRVEFCKGKFEGLIDIAITGISGGFPKRWLSIEGQKATGYPIKNAIGYLNELQNYIRRASVRLEGDYNTYNTRNPLKGKAKEKGKKGILRMQQLCELTVHDETTASVKNMCDFLQNISISEIEKIDPDEFEVMIDDLTSNQTETVKVDMQEKISQLLLHITEGSYNNITEDMIVYINDNPSLFSLSELALLFEVFCLPSHIEMIEVLSEKNVKLGKSPIDPSTFLWKLVYAMKMQDSSYDVANTSDVWLNIPNWENNYDFKPSSQILSECAFGKMSTSESRRAVALFLDEHPEYFDTTFAEGLIWFIEGLEPNANKSEIIDVINCYFNNLSDDLKLVSKLCYENSNNFKICSIIQDLQDGKESFKFGCDFDSLFLIDLDPERDIDQATEQIKLGMAYDNKLMVEKTYQQGMPRFKYVPIFQKAKSYLKKA